MNRLPGLLILMISLLIQSCNAQLKNIPSTTDNILTGADQTTLYLHFLKDKRVALFANPTSVIGKTHLLDTLLSSGVNVVTIFGPEHGFRGKADAGEHVSNDVDAKTGIPVISLYGDHKKPTAEDLKNVDVMLFDIQDVGVRYYTFISSLQYYMEAAIENEKELIILDRPNPNGFYVDGPVLDTAFKSFVGMQPVPIVYGMTIGEYALMLIGERWLNDKANKRLDELEKDWNQAISPVKNVNTYFNFPTQKNSEKKLHFSAVVIPCKNYTHDSKYVLPVNPSPNLKEIQSIYLYPSICFFEGTVMSEGRGTDKPFQIFGHPSLPATLFSFTPKPNEGAKNSKCFNQVCYGWNLSGSKEEVLKKVDNKIQIKYLLEAYQLFPGKDSFFLKNNFFYKLAGNNILMQQIKEGKPEIEIRKSWDPGLEAFKAIRKKYLLYHDFKQ